MELIKDLAPGSRIRLQDSSNYCCEATVKNVDGKRKILSLTDCTEVTTGKKEPGVQKFFADDIVKLAVVSGGAQESLGTSSLQAVKDEELGNDSPCQATRNARLALRRGMVSEKTREDNPHLSRLYPVDMKKLLSQEQMRDVPDLARLSLQVGKPTFIPTPEQIIEHQEGEAFKDRYNPMFTSVRRVLWKDPKSPPSLEACPHKWYLIDDFKEGGGYKYALEALEKENIVSVSLEGQSLGRHGNLSLVSVATRTEVFLFDIVKLPQCMEELQDLFESPATMKVFHDVRLPSDILFHQYNTKLVNVYDTMAMHDVFMVWAHQDGLIAKYAATMNNLARAYLGIAGASLFFPHYRKSCMSMDTAVWLERPLPQHLELGAVQNVIYLLDLQRVTRECFHSPFIRATECLLSNVRDAEDFEAEHLRHDDHLLPRRYRDCLPDWSPNPSRASKLGIVEPDKRVIHNCVGQMDPNLIFSRDCIHQNKD